MAESKLPTPVNTALTDKDYVPIPSSQYAYDRMMAEAVFINKHGFVILHIDYGSVMNTGSYFCQRFWAPSVNGPFIEYKESGSTGRSEPDAGMVSYEALVTDHLDRDKVTSTTCLYYDRQKSNKLTVSVGKPDDDKRATVDTYTRLTKRQADAAMENHIRKAAPFYKIAPFREAAYLFHFESYPNRSLFVTCPGGNDDYYKSFRAYELACGKSNSWGTIPQVTRYRDGGTTIMSWSDGREIYSPTSFKKDAKPYYQDASGVKHTLIRVNYKDIPDELMQVEATEARVPNVLQWWTLSA